MSCGFSAHELELIATLTSIETSFAKDPRKRWLECDFFGGECFQKHAPHSLKT